MSRHMRGAMARAAAGWWAPLGGGRRGAVPATCPPPPPGPPETQHGCGAEEGDTGKGRKDERDARHDPCRHVHGPSRTTSWSIAGGLHGSSRTQIPMVSRQIGQVAATNTVPRQKRGWAGGGPPGRAGRVESGSGKATRHGPESDRGALLWPHFVCGDGARGAGRGLRGRGARPPVLPSFAQLGCSAGRPVVDGP